MSGARLAGVAALTLVLAAPVGAAVGETEDTPQAMPSAPAMLVERWAGVYDSVEQMIFDQTGAVGLGLDPNRRVRTIVAPVSLPWLGSEVLYLEEFPHDDPDGLRRLLLLKLSVEAAARPGTVRVRQFTFREPVRWRHLPEDKQLLGALQRQDLEATPGCDLLLVRDGEQFRGGTVGRGCIESLAAPENYVDYRLLVGRDLYWYRKRLLRVADDELLQEALGFQWFELHRARLFACRIRWVAAEQPQSNELLTTVELQDQGGRARFMSPDGRSFELELHSRDWPFDANRDALILVVRELGAGAPLVSAWTEVSANQIAVGLDAMEVRCGPLAPSGDDLRF